jgi:hypothetical protein
MSVRTTYENPAFYDTDIPCCLLRDDFYDTIIPVIKWVIVQEITDRGLTRVAL